MKSEEECVEEYKEEGSNSFWSKSKDVAIQVFYFCQLNGGYFALYGLMIPSILMNIFSAVFNEYSFFYFWLHHFCSFFTMADGLLTVPSIGVPSFFCQARIVCGPI